MFPVSLPFPWPKGADREDAIPNRFFKFFLRMGRDFTPNKFVNFSVILGTSVHEKFSDQTYRFGSKRYEGKVLGGSNHLPPSLNYFTFFSNHEDDIQF